MRVHAGASTMRAGANAAHTASMQLVQINDVMRAPKARYTLSAGGPSLGGPEFSSA
jgi:hypothetical protein